MKGQKYKLNDNYTYTCRDSNDNIVGYATLNKGTVVTIINTEVHHQVEFDEFDHLIGWISSYDQFWNLLDRC